MKILFVAPEISPPYTEGRKRFVLDLIDELKNTHNIELITTLASVENLKDIPHTHSTHCKFRACHLLYPIYELRKTIRKFKPDVVCHFPYGTFRGIYWYASTWSMSIIDRICSSQAIPCISIMYSIDEHTTPEALSKKVSCLAVSQRNGWNGSTINIGVSDRTWPTVNNTKKKTNTQILLFMAGMWKQHEDTIEHILNTRGLRLLLRAGEYLSNKNIKLIIASPALSTQKLKKYLLNHPDNKWNHSQLIIRAEVNVPEIYSEADLFVFPYQKNINQFIPTSVIESMLTGTTVAISNQEFLLPIANQGKTAYIFDSNDIDSLVVTINTALQNNTKRRSIGRNAQEYAQQNWSIAASARQLISLASKLTNKERTKTTE